MQAAEGGCPKTQNRITQEVQMQKVSLFMSLFMLFAVACEDGADNGNNGNNANNINNADDPLVEAFATNLTN